MEACDRSQVPDVRRCSGDDQEELHGSGELQTSIGTRAQFNISKMFVYRYVLDTGLFYSHVSYFCQLIWKQ